MTVDDGDVRIIAGDAVEAVRTLTASTVQVVISSPPFWGLRDYGTASWVGGDPACNHDGRRQHAGSKQASNEGSSRDPVRGGACRRCGAVRVDSQIGLESTPEEWANRLVEVYRECRRVLRDDGVMFVEVGDTYTSSGGPGGGVASFQTNNAGSLARLRPSASCKPKDLVGAPWLLAFALRADGWYLRAEIIWAKPNPMPESVTDRPTRAHSTVFLLSKRPRYFWDADAIAEPVSPASDFGRPRPTAPMPSSTARALAGASTERFGNGSVGSPAGANARSVWTIPPEPTPFAHFATFPQKLVERMVLASTREGDIILDPFIGSGTTALVARRLGRCAIGVELNPEYVAIARRRLAQLSLFAPPAPEVAQ